ncbi:MAG: adenylate/guanylate cyclase domain-containing protein [Geminicoccaceae bacterium]
MASLFSIGLGLILLVSIGSVLAISTIGARKALVAGLAEDFDLIIGTIEERVIEHMSASERQLDFLSDFLTRYSHLVHDNERLTFAMKGLLAPASQVSALAFIRPDGSSVRVERENLRVSVDDLFDRGDLQALVRKAETWGPDFAHRKWSEPYRSGSLNRSIIVRRQPVWIDGAFAGLLLASVDLLQLSRFAANVSDSIGHTVFILHGRDHVIAHPLLLERTVLAQGNRPTVTIEELGDGQMREIWSPDRREVISQPLMRRSEGHYLFRNGDWQVFVYSDLKGYGATPWLVGFYFDSSTRGSEVWRFWQLFAAGSGLLLLFTAFGAWVGRRTARPLRLLTENAAAIQRLDFAAVRPMRGSRIVEFDRAAKAMDGMIAGLRVFERYVPKRLVERIVRDGQHEIVADVREITILFIDIVGFFRMTEKMTPRQTGLLLNEHFGRVGAGVDRYEGTIDKYLGDGLLALWGAPEDQPDHAARACLAADAIRRSILEDNERRRESGRPPIRVRIGINSGRAIVGDIGAANRVNYTAIGDAVNIASRVQEAARGYAEGDVTILATAGTVEAAARHHQWRDIGPTQLRDRDRPVRLFEML